MKMKKPYLEVVRFDSSDVIATSGATAHSWDSMAQKLTCPDGNSATHLVIDEFKYGKIRTYDFADGRGKNFRDDIGYGSFADPAETDKWYVYGEDNLWHLCNGGQ